MRKVADWPIEKIKNLVTTVPQYGANAPSVKYDPTLPRYIRITDIKEDGALSNQSFKSILEADAEGYILRKGDFLFARSGATVGKTYLHKNDGKKRCAFAGYLIRFRFDEEQLLPEFLAQYTQTSRYWYWVQSMIRAGAQPNINAQEYCNLDIPLPPLKIQKKIVETISTWDTAIGKNRRLIAAKEMVKKGLMQRLLFGKVRVGGRKTTGAAGGKWFSIPSDWKSARIGFVAKEVSKKNTNGDNLPVLSCTKHHGLVDSLEYFDKQVFSKDTSTYKVVEKGQFAYATNHIEEGSIGYQDIYPKGLISPMYTVFTTDSKKMNAGYLYKLLKTETYRRIFAINTNASVDRRGSLRWKEFAKLPIPLPDLDEQEEINQVLETAQQELTLLCAKLAALQKQKRGLMQKLLTGQWRVKLDGADE